MSGTPSYTKPPVREALIDIQIDAVSPDYLESLAALHKNLISDYPIKKTRNKIQGAIKIEGQTVTTTPTVAGPIGYWFESEDQKRIVQVRLDGFTFNRLKPDPHEGWPGWSALREEARRAWELYAEALNLRDITRLAVRYINQILIPKKYIELNDYFTAAPQIPPGLSYQRMGSFISRIEIPIPDHKAMAILTQSPAQEKYSESLAFILDIDVFRNERVSIGGSTIWEALDRLRDLMNTIFEASLLPRAKELFR